MGTKSQMATEKDVVTYLKNQHQDIKGLFASTLRATGEERKRAFYALRRMMAVHESAEEQIVHRAAARKLGPQGVAIVNARLAEERKAKTALIEIEQLDITSAEFATRLRTLEQDVLTHAESEERQEFGKLREALDTASLAKMTRAVELVESIAPTRPHPTIESPVANLLAGPFASIVDRARDAFSGKN